jgi:hypothetical protein
MTGWTYKSEDESEFIDEISKLSDRLVGLLAPIILDNRITEAVQRRLKDGPLKSGATIFSDLFAPHGELGSFGTRVRLAYAMGIFSQDAYADVTRIEKIRNEFAHRLSIKSFNDQPVIDLVRHIKINERFPMKGPHVIVMKDHEKGWAHKFGPSNYDDEKPREKFLRAIQIISHQLYLRLNWNNPDADGPI